MGETDARLTSGREPEGCREAGKTGTFVIPSRGRSGENRKAGLWPGSRENQNLRGSGKPKGRKTGVRPQAGREPEDWREAGSVSGTVLPRNSLPACVGNAGSGIRNAVLLPVAASGDRPIRQAGRLAERQKAGRTNPVHPPYACLCLPLPVCGGTGQKPCAMLPANDRSSVSW